MIHDFALEPELVATWHDQRAAHPVVSQMGSGQRRVACIFPFPAWTKLVMACFQTLHAGLEMSGAQHARKNMEVMLRHLQETAARRKGRLLDGETWLDAAMREHRDFPFGGIVVRSFAERHPAVVSVDRLPENACPAWTPVAPPVLRRATELATALAPLLRCAVELRFVDPYFDAEDAAFYEPMAEYLRVAQRRRSVGDLRLQLHLAVRSDEVDQASRLKGSRLTEDDVAAVKLAACERRLGPLLATGVSLHAVAWRHASGWNRFHNRYVLSEVGGIAVPTGLDQGRAGTLQTDDLTVLSHEQHVARRDEFRPDGARHRLIAKRVFAGAQRP